MLRSHKIALDVNNAQRTLLRQHFGLARVAYNHALRDFKDGLDADEWRNDMTLRPRWNAAKRELFPWCVDLSQMAAKNAILNLGLAINAWRGMKKDGTKRKSKSSFPRFKKKGKHNSYQADNGRGTISVDGAHVTLPKVGRLRMREELRFDGEIVGCVVSEKAGRCYASFTVDAKCAAPTKREGRSIGVDVGLKTLAQCSDGVNYSNPAPLKRLLARLRRHQRALARRKKGSNRRLAMKKRIARLHKRIADVRSDAHHKATTAIAKRGAAIGCETLNVKGMMRNRRLSRALADAGLAEFIRQLEYKCELYGASFEKKDRWFPSSKLCHQCGWKNDGLTLAMREWTCRCGAVLDRDLNASINLEPAASSAVSGRGRLVRRPAFVPGAAAVETSTRHANVAA